MLLISLVPEAGVEPAQARGPGDFETHDHTFKPLHYIKQSSNINYLARQLKPLRTNKNKLKPVAMDYKWTMTLALLSLKYEFESNIHL